MSYCFDEYENSINSIQQCTIEILEISMNRLKINKYPTEQFDINDLDLYERVEIRDKTYCSFSCIKYIIGDEKFDEIVLKGIKSNDLRDVECSLFVYSTINEIPEQFKNIRIWKSSLFYNRNMN